MTGHTIADVMSPDPIVLSPEASVREAAEAMRSSAVGDVLVADEGGLRGIVTDRDIIVRCIADGADPDEVRLDEVCTPDPITVNPETPIEEAVSRIREEAVRRLPVVDGNQVVGIVSIGDLAIDRDPDSALADISRSAPSS